jgi:hypothetical protein
MNTTQLTTGNPARIATLTTLAVIEAGLSDPCLYGLTRSLLGDTGMAELATGRMHAFAAELIAHEICRYLAVMSGAAQPLA